MNIAIYSRKSVFKEAGDSVQNQIELCDMYIKRNFFNNEEIKIEIFEDDGFSAKNTNRPEFKRMIKKIENGEIDKLICYKLDRISRSVADFSTILDLLQKNNCDFISISEQFDTTSPIGRAMIYIASIFAQLERESIAERVKDSMMQMAKRGMFLGGKPSLGFNVKRIKYMNEEMREKEASVLVPNLKELELVSTIYKTYLECGSVTGLEKILFDNGIKNRNNSYYKTSVLVDILRNPVYVKSNNKVHTYLCDMGMQVCGAPNGNGYLIYNKSNVNGKKKDKSEWICAISKNKGYIEPQLWLEVQKLLDKNKDKKIKRLGTGNNASLLAGLLKCKVCGANMLPRANGGQYKQTYYICTNKKKRGEEKCTCKNIRVDYVDNAVLDSIKIYSKEVLSKSLDSYIKDNISNNSDNYIKSNIEDQIKEKELFMNSLIEKLAVSTNERVTEILMEQIDNADKEIRKLKIKLEDNLNEEKENKSEIENIRYFINNLSSFSKNIEIIDSIQFKRECLSKIIDKVVWDPDNFKATVSYSIDIENNESKKK